MLRFHTLVWRYERQGDCSIPCHSVTKLLQLTLDKGTHSPTSTFCTTAALLAGEADAALGVAADEAATAGTAAEPEATASSFDVCGAAGGCMPPVDPLPQADSSGASPTKATSNSLRPAAASGGRKASESMLRSKHNRATTPAQSRRPLSRVAMKKRQS